MFKSKITKLKLRETFNKFYFNYDYEQKLLQKNKDKINYINKKVINLEKGLSAYDIKDSLVFPTTSEYNSVYPPNVYRQLDEHGVFEITDEKYNFE